MKADSQNSLIITAASESFGPSLLALLGSLNLNWSGHPPVLVYDIGLDPVTLNYLNENGILVKKVPSFCPHWRHHFTWKIWCLNDAPARDIVWMDAGLVVLQPLDEILLALDRQGYFVTTNYELLDWEASEEACNGCGVSTDFRIGKLTLPGTLMGFRKTGKVPQILAEALSVALAEKHIAATKIDHRHDQAIISLLIYKYLEPILIADGAVYLGSLSPRQIPGQKVWVHRRNMLKADVKYFAAHIAGPGEAYAPSQPCSMRRARGLSNLYKVYWHFGKGERGEAREHLEMAFAIDPTLKKEPKLLAKKLYSSGRKLKEYFDSEAVDRDFISWTLEQLKTVNGAFFIWKLKRYLKRERSYRRS